MRAIRMSKNKTVVEKCTDSCVNFRSIPSHILMALSFFALSLPLNSFAEKTAVEQLLSPEDCAYVVESAGGKMKKSGSKQRPDMSSVPANKRSSVGREYASCIKGIFPETDHGKICTDNVTEYKDLYRKYASSCKSAYKSPNVTGCLENIRKCEECLAEQEDCGDDYTDDHSFTNFTQALASGNVIGGASSPNYNASAGIYSACPHIAKEDLDTYKDQYKDARDDARSSRTTFEEKQSEMQTAQEELKNLEEEIETEAARLIRESRGDVQKITRRHEDALRAVEGEISKINSEIAALRQQKSAVDLEMKQVDNEAKVERAKVSAQCHQVAKEKVLQDRQEARQKIANNRYSTNSARSLFSSVGVSGSRKRNSRANRLKQACLTEGPMAAQIAAIERTRGIKLEALIRKKENFDLQIQAKIAGIDQIKKSVPDAARRAVEDIQQIQTDLQTNLQMLDKRLQNARETAHQKMVMLQQQVQTAQMDYQLDQNRVNEQEVMLRMRKRYAKGVTYKAGEGKEIFSDYPSLLSSAESVISTCCENGSTHSYCKPACKFLKDDNSNYKSLGCDFSSTSTGSPSGVKSDK